MARENEYQDSFCTECGTPFEPDMGFCPECGSPRPECPAEVVCESCQTPNPPDCSFCVECGEPLPGLPETEEAPSSPSAGAITERKHRRGLGQRRRRLVIAISAAAVVIAGAIGGILWWQLPSSDPLAADSPESAARATDLVVKYYYPEYQDAQKDVCPFTTADGNTAYQVTYSGSDDPADPAYQRHQLIATIDPATSEVSFAITN